MEHPTRGSGSSSSSPASRPSPPPPSSPPPPPPPPYTTSLATDLFGPRPDLSQSTSYFDNIFGPASMGLVRRNYTSPEAVYGNNTRTGTPPDGSTQGSTDWMSTTTQMARSPCSYSSSIYYGGQDDIVSTISTRPKKKQEDDINDETYANRGDWWKGSYHY